MTSLPGALTDVVNNYKGTVFNFVAILFTGGVQQLTTLLTFKCPCIDSKDLPESCRNLSVESDAACMSKINRVYGLSFIIAPAVGFFVFGLVLKQKLWRAVTGHRYKQVTESLEQSKYWATIFTAILRSLIYPLAWVSLALLDGRFLACALTPLPYDLQNSYYNCWKVTQAVNPRTSSWFESNRRFSQTLGLFVISGSLVIGFLIFALWQYTSPFTFYHAQYFKDFRRKEVEEINKMMKLEAEKEAVENVKELLYFSPKNKPKELWDRISSIYDFPQGNRKILLNSNLQDWAEQERQKRLIEYPEATTVAPSDNLIFDKNSEKMEMK